jgi:hypothetical protein
MLSRSESATADFNSQLPPKINRSRPRMMKITFKRKVVSLKILCANQLADKKYKKNKETIFIVF